MSIGIVKTNYGYVRGVESSEERYAGITYFKGIPYAAPPVGDLRWKAPVRPAAWEGVRECDAHGPQAMQFVALLVRKTQEGEMLQNEPFGSDFHYASTGGFSEDCLYLNVTTGADSMDEKRPVYMWFHGGGLAGGNSYEVEFEPSELARKGIVVASVGQRLGPFGYLCLPQLTADQGSISGNYGLLDEVAALDWVYENIAAFGGDPENITVGGQSGGSAKSGALAASPLQRGRIRRVINQSFLMWPDGLMPFMSPEKGYEMGRDLLQQLGIDPDMPAEELRRLPAEKFFGSKLDFVIGAMVVDGYSVPYPEAWRALHENAAYCDILAGHNLGELFMRSGDFLDFVKAMTLEEYYETAKERLGDLYDKYRFEENFPCTPENADRLSRRMAALGLTDFGGEIINRYFGKYRKNKGEKGKTYSYLFSHITPCREEERGTKRDSDRLLSWHSAELWYTFASLRKSEDGLHNVPPVRPWTDLDVKLADQISSYWANFMKTGDPNGTDSNGDPLPVWPESDGNMGWIELGDVPEGHTGSDSVLDRMLLEYMFRQVKIPD